MSRVRHASQVPPERRISAPYNFVPLPDAPLLYSEESQVTPSFDRFHADRLSGVIEYEAECLSPVFTRAAAPTDAEGLRKMRVARQAKEDRDDKPPLSADFFHHGDPLKPILPGSTMRGMIRSVVRILSAGKFPQSKDRRLFFRSFSGGIMNEVYSAHFVENKGKVEGPSGLKQGYRCRSEAGFLVEENGVFYIERCYELRVARRLLPVAEASLYVMPRGESGSERNPNRIPNPSHQYRPVWVRVPSLKKDWRSHAAKTGIGMYSYRRDVEALSFQKGGEPGSHKGYLVITGDMQNKKAEFVFVPYPKEEATRLPVSLAVIEDVNSDDQISQWQEQAYPPDGKLNPQQAVSQGLPGLPVWFLLDDNDQVICVGRSQNFRLRYQHRTRELVPQELLADDVSALDLTERLFGKVTQTGKTDSSPVRGRLSFLDAHCLTSTPFLGPIRAGGPPEPYRVPRILASPKPTAFQLYVTQPSAEEARLVHYDVKTPGEVRGTKLYWHRNRAESHGQVQPLGESELFKETLDLTSQDTLIRPVRSQTKFAGSIRFENLALEELGALLSALELPEGMAHKLGLGKPLGLGSVRIGAVQLRLWDRAKRYGSWDGNDALSPPNATKAIEAKEQFRKLMVEHHLGKEPALPAVGQSADLWTLPRPAQLAALLAWKNAPEVETTRYATLDRFDAQKWRRRHVLPSPLDVIGKPLMEAMPLAQPDAAAGPAINKPRVLIHGVRVVRLLRPRPGSRTTTGAESWDAVHPDTGIELEVRRVRIPPNQRGKEWAQVVVSMVSNRWVADFLALTVEPSPDNLPHESRALAEIVSGEPGLWKARLVRGSRIWELRGTPPPGISVALGAKLTVRIVRPIDSKEHYLTFAQERS